MTAASPGPTDPRLAGSSGPPRRVAARVSRGARRGLTVVSTGVALAVQDLGRPGWAHLGVPRSGALDREALQLANRLVGNPADAAGLELLLGGAVIDVGVSTRVALTGATMLMSLDGRPVGWGESISVHAGQRLEVGAPPTGLRSWLAVAGGIDVPAELGSRSTDTLTGLGPPGVSAGEVLPVGEAPTTYVADAHAVPAQPTQDVVLRLRLGPRDDWFTTEAVDRLATTAYAVSPDSDRVGVRLQDESGRLKRTDDRELASEGIVLGAVQVPGDGQPLVFLADHPTTGGYPVIGVVAAADVARCAQLRPGDLARFRVDPSPSPR